MIASTLPPDQHQGAAHGRVSTGNRTDDEAVVRLAPRERSTTLCRHRSGQAGAWGCRVHGRHLGVRSQDHSARPVGIGGHGGVGHRTGAKKGGGRKRLITISADLEENFFQVLRDHTAGDPMRPEVKWTNLSRRQIAKRLTAMGTPVGRDVVSQLLRKHGYRKRKALKKKTMGRRDPDRNAQFENIARLKREYLAAGWPVISIDTKRKELLGDFYREGTIGTRETIETNDHDFGSAGSGTVIPHGIYDVGRNRGFLHLNTSHDTSELACDSIARGGSSRGGPTIPRPQSSWSCAMAAAATAPPAMSSRGNSRSWPTGWGSRSEWPTTRPTARSITRSSTDCSRT